MNVAQKIIKCLEQSDVPYVFGIPGEETLDLLDALRNSRIRFIATRHEQGAAFMAATCGRLTGIPGVCLTTLGPGAINAMTGIAYAFLGQMPMMLISGQKPVGEVKQGNFQMVDVIGSMQPITLLSQRFVKPEAVSSMLFQALHTSSTFPYGPVHIELAEDVAKKRVSESMAQLKQFEINSLPRASDKDIEKAVALIKKAAAPLLICGQHACRQDVAEALETFSEKTGMPFATTQMGKGALDETHDLYMGTMALSDGDFVHKIAAQADLLIMVGHNESEKPPLMACCHSQTILHIHDVPPIINETYFPSHALIGDMAGTIAGMSKTLNKVSVDRFEELKKAFTKHEQDLRADAIPFMIVEQVREAIADDGIVTLDNGMYKIWFARHYRARKPNTLLLDNALATMGAGLPSAIAAKLVHSDRDVIAVCGDGGFMMTGQELETAVRLQLNLVILILCDKQFGMISWKQQIDGYEPFGMDFGNPDFAALAESYGAHGHKLGGTFKIGKQIRACLKVGGVHVIEAPIDYSADHIFSELDEITAIK
jgi:acetolactate synthase I/II/III large subunit